MTQRKRRSKKIIRMKRKNSKVATFSGFLLLVIVTLFILMLTPFFNIKWIDIKGAEKITSGQIKTAISYSQGTNLFKINLKKSEENLEALPYVKDAEVKRKFPDGVRVYITERTPVAYIEFGGAFVLIDSEGRMLEQVSEKPDKIPAVLKAPVEGLKVGQYLKDKSEEASQAFVVLYEKLNEYQLYERVSGINVGTADSISFAFDGNKNVIIGDGYRLDYKLMMLQAAIDGLAPSESGTITLTVEGKAIFTPKE